MQWCECCGHLVAPGLAHGPDEGGGSEGLGQEGDDEREKVGASHHGIRSTTGVTVLRATAFESSHINAALPKPLHEEGNRLGGLGTGAAQIGSPPCLIFGVGSLWPCPLLHFLSSCVIQSTPIFLFLVPFFHIQPLLLHGSWILLFHH